MRPDLEFLLSAVYDNAGLNPEHLADLRKSGLTPETIRVQRFRSVPPATLNRLLGFDVTGTRSALLIPFPDPAGGFMDFIRVKVFPPLLGRTGTVKYLQPRGAMPHLFFPLATLATVREPEVALWAVEGEKKALCAAQLGLAAIGFCGIHGWHRKGSTALLDDFDAIPLRGRLVELVPDGDFATNPHVRQGAERLAEALHLRGARVRLVALPQELTA